MVRSKSVYWRSCDGHCKEKSPTSLRDSLLQHGEQDQLQTTDTLPHIIREGTLLNLDQAVQQTPLGAEAFKRQSRGVAGGEVLLYRRISRTRLTKINFFCTSCSPGTWINPIEFK